MRYRNAKRSLYIFLMTVLLALNFFFMSDKASADGIRGFVELDYTKVDTESEDAAGLSTKTKANSFLQRYNLTLERSFYPYLKLIAGGIFEKNKSETKTNDLNTESTVTSMRPSIDLRLNSPMYIAGLGYNRREEKTSVSGASDVTNIRENYSASLGWRPDRFPEVNVHFLKTITHDKDRVIQDSEIDYITLSLAYKALRDFDFRYQLAYSDSDNKINDLQTRQFTHTGRATYSSRFFDNRVSLYTSYNITHQETETISRGTGFVYFQAFPFSGLSSIDDSPATDALNPDAALIDGSVTVGSGINIGLPPVAGDTRERNIGLDFFNDTEVNTIYVWVNRDLPTAISSSFSWTVYTSADNLNWVPLTTVSAVQFGPFERRFEINFANVTARYIKVVTRPLTQAVALSVPSFQNPDQIFVTEIQAFIRRPVDDVKSKTELTSHVYNLNTRTRLLDSPYVFYDLSIWYSETQPSSISRYIVSNGIAVNHRFNPMFSGTARIAREDSKEARGDKIGYIYSATLTAVTLKTLNHNLIFSGRFDEREGESSDINSIFINNYAELYKGIDVNLSAGVSFSTSETGEKRKNYITNLNASLVPHSNMTVTINYSDTVTKGNTDSFSRRGDLGVAFTPFRTLYLFASNGIVSEKNRKTKTLQNYAVNWAPFPDGDIQFNFSFTESLDSEESMKTRAVGPSIRWNILRNAYWEISYLVLSSSSDINTTESKIFNSNLKMTF